MFYVFWCDFFTRCWWCTNQQMRNVFFVVIFLSEIHDRYNDPKKRENDCNLSDKIEIRQASHSCVRMRCKFEGMISDRNSQNWAGHGKNAMFLGITCYYVYIKSLFGTTSSWVANWAIKLIYVVIIFSLCSLHRAWLSRSTGLHDRRQTWRILWRCLYSDVQDFTKVIYVHTAPVIF